MVNSIYFKKIELNEGEACKGIFGFLQYTWNNKNILKNSLHIYI